MGRTRIQRDRPTEPRCPECRKPMHACTCTNHCGTPGCPCPPPRVLRDIAEKLR